MTFIPEDGPQKGKSFNEYIIEVCSKNYPSEEYYYTTRECGEFFSLFMKCVDIYFEKKSNLNGQKKMEEILDSAITMMKKHDSREKSTSIYEDKVLIGYMNLISKILSHH